MLALDLVDTEAVALSVDAVAVAGALAVLACDAVDLDVVTAVGVGLAVPSTWGTSTR
jgi:hypothetical protein